MKIVVVECKEADGGRLAVLLSAEDLWAFQILCARAGQEILRVAEEQPANAS